MSAAEVRIKPCNRMDSMFQRVQSCEERALVTFLSAGDPTPEATLPLLCALAEGGADLIELGVPFSDPVADGPVIQRASQRALAAGATLGTTLEAVRGFRAAGWETPVILFGYLNPFLAYGVERLMQDAASAGVDGFLIVDLPPEEGAALREAAAAVNLHTILLISPNTPAARGERIVGEAAGFLYYVALKGVTGSAVADFDAVGAKAAALRATTSVPVCVGFGVRTPSDARALGRHVDGVVVGTALVQLVEAHGASAAPRVRELTAALKGALRPVEG